MPVQLTGHAATRMRQRSIPLVAVELLAEFAHEQHDHRGAAVLSFDKRSRAAARNGIGDYAFRALEHWFNAYAVISDSGAVITVGWRKRRFARN